jgi:hypothetical protein
MNKFKIVDETGGLVVVLPPVIRYARTEPGRRVDSIIHEIINVQNCTRTFDLGQIKAALSRCDTKSFSGYGKKKDTLLFLGRHMAGGGYILIEVELVATKKKFVIKEVKYDNEVFENEVYIAYASN